MALKGEKYLYFRTVTAAGDDDQGRYPIVCRCVEGVIVDAVEGIEKQQQRQEEAEIHGMGQNGGILHQRPDDG